MPLIRVHNWPGYDHMITVAAREFNSPDERLEYCELTVKQALREAAQAAEMPTVSGIGTLSAGNFVVEIYPRQIGNDQKTVLIIVDMLYTSVSRELGHVSRFKDVLEEAANELQLPKGWKAMVTISGAPQH